MSELKGIVNTKARLKGTVNPNSTLKGLVSVGGTLIGAETAKRGLQGNDGYSPTATVSKVGSTATITITDKNGTTTADIYDGSGASAFIAEYGVTTYADVKDAYDEDAIIICTVDDSGNTVICQLAYYDDANGLFYFAQPQSDGFYLAIIASDDTWDDSYFTFASTDTATQLRNGLMDALDKQKLDTIASGAEVNVQSDWNEADNTKDDFIKNKPSIPTKVSDLNNDSGFITSSSLPSNLSDLNNDMDVSEFPNDAGYITSAHEIPSGGTTGQVLTKDSGTDYDVSWTTVSGGGSVNDVTVDGTSVVTAGVAEIDLMGKADVAHTHTKSQITDFPSLATVATTGDYDDLTDTPAIHNVPSGGSSGQVLSKASGTDYDLAWVDQSGGGGGVTDVTQNGTSVVTGGVAAVTVPTDTGDLTNGAGFITGMTILSYGNSTWNDFITAYNANKVVYCRASSNANPATGSQNRLAFMAYVNNATTPTEVEFQYYRSVSSHSASQQGDQVFVYKLNKTNGWSVTTREASSKVVAGTGLSSSYSSGVLTLTSSGEANVQSDWSQSDTTADDYIKNKPSIPTKVSDLNNDSGFITGYTETDPVFSASAAAGITATDISNWNNGKLSLDTSAAAGTTDGDLYAAIVALGWASDVIE